MAAMSRISQPRISKRLAAVSESATLAIDAKAKALKASGSDV
ncbi:MAG: aspartate aminotransferase, partial [Actinomycetota bacterium]|nr:aspartate aminotransferase [Actinomycetota bacterium]